MGKWGCVYKKGQFWWIKYYSNGKPYYESSKSEDRRDAEKLLLKRELEFDQGKLPIIQAEKTTFNELVEGYLRDYEIHGKKTLKRAKECVEHLKAHFGGMRAHDITTELIHKYIDKRKIDGVTNATINRELSAMKRMFNLGLQQTPPKVLRIPYFKKLEEKNIRKGYFEHDEFLAIREALPDYLKALTTLAYYTGMRKGEVLGLRWDQVDLKEGLLRLEQEDTKNSQPRTIYLNDEIWRMLVAQKRDRDLRFPDMPFVFYSPKGEPIGDFRKAWATACTKAGLQGKLFHDFRRTGVRNAVRSGTPERVAMSISGQKTRSIFDRYNIVNEHDLKIAAQKIEAYTRAQSEKDPFKELEEVEAVRRAFDEGNDD